MLGRVLLAVLVTIVLNVPSRSFVSPRVIMFYGEPLKAPIFITGEDSRVLHDLQNPASLTVADVRHRPFVAMASFWGTEWDDYYFGRRSVQDLTPEQAGQHGRLYLGDDSKPPVVLQTYPRLRPVPLPVNDMALTWGGELPSTVVEKLRSFQVPLSKRPVPK